MAVPGTYNRGYTAAGQSFSTSASISSDLASQWSESLAVAKVGTLSTRSSGTAGTLTMASGHGITDGQRLDIYWDGGSAYGATVGTVATNSVPFTLAQGDALPIATTAITAQVPTSIPVVVTGDDVLALGVGFTQGGIAVFAASGNTTIAAFRPVGTPSSYVYSSSDGGTNPLAGGAVTHVYLSQGSLIASTANGVVQFD